MSLKAMASATIQFGMVAIPVKVYPSTKESEKVSFNLLHKGCNSRIKQQVLCPVHGKVLTEDEIVRGYEHAKGEYVVFTSEELKALESEKTTEIAIDNFLPPFHVPNGLYDKTYFLGPDKGTTRSYTLLLKAMDDLQAAAVAKYTMKGKEHLVLIRVLHGRLVMHQLHWPENVRRADELELVDVEILPEELGIARQLIQNKISDNFDAEKYKDETKARLLKAVKDKVDGKEVTIAVPQAPQAQTVDLLAALKASLAAQTPVKKPEVQAKPVSKPKKKAAAK